MDNTKLKQSDNVDEVKTGYLPNNVINQQSVTQTQKDNWHWFQVYTACTIKLLLSIIAGTLVWQCNSKEHLLVKIIFTILAVMFSEIYILYYAIYRTYMGNKCPV